MHGRYSVLAHYLKVSLKNSRFLKIPKLHPQMCGFLYGVLRLCLSWARYSAGVMPYSARKLFKKLL